MYSELLSMALWALPFWNVPTVVAAEEPPVLDLPWGKWQAQIDPEDPKAYIFRNVRFGAQPERFGAPAFPSTLNDSIQTPETVSCISIDPSVLVTPPGGQLRFEEPDPQLPMNEDCLFLDIYAPKSAFETGAPKLPVVVWIFGGAYALGSKNQGGVLYTGRPTLKAANHQVIFIAGNYRTGALGFLAGDYMQKAGKPNAGLYDQALLFEWVRDYVDQAGGDKTKVSAWGESAGAGSILHHLIREDGERDPLFHSLVAQSPAYEMSWDNSPDGRLDTMYRTFSELAGCGFAYDIDCLKAVTPEKIIEANQEFFDKVRQTGLFPVGPAVDGEWIRSIPSVSLSQGKHWAGLDAAIISHCSNESEAFIPKGIDTEEKFDAFLYTFLPGEMLAPQRQQIKEKYDCEKTFPGNYKACLGLIVQHAAFTCNTRYMFEAYPEKSYMMEYAYPSDVLGSHGSDLIPLFTSNMLQAQAFLEKMGVGKVQAAIYAAALHAQVAPDYTKYLASFAISKDPNDWDEPTTWPLAKDVNGKISNALRVQTPTLFRKTFALTEDKQNTKDDCDFWRTLAEEILGEEVQRAQSDKHDEL
ncbi:Secreted lipase [Cladobotryum mycophilum]|uniref:Secreted lipase n=1 Tax=Cladobotryum mycophilum TaxID=491253 RepID=A0ABR0SBW7_9HYPO